MSLASLEFKVAGIKQYWDFYGAKKVLLHPEVLKGAKVSTGDIVVVRSLANEEINTFAIGALWPSTEIRPGDVVINDDFCLTIGALEGTSVRLLPLHADKPSHGFPSLDQLEEASLVTLKLLEGGIPAGTAENREPERWLCILLRERLVSLGLISDSQTITVQYEGTTLYFRVHAVQSRTTLSSTTASLEQLSLRNLKVPSIPCWKITWDTEVTLDVSQSREREHTKGIQTDIKAEAYSEVGGLQKQISQIRDLVDIPLTRPTVFKHFGLRPPRGLLLFGPPGTGKTHLARAVAASTSASVLLINGPELSSAYHGETEAKLRDAFADARRRSPCIVVIDEVDALCPRRDDGNGGEVEKRVVATMLTILDGYVEDGNEDRVFIIATTNRPNAIDPALRRPGRFDREIEIGVPDAVSRQSILKVLLAKSPHNLTDDDFIAIANRTHGHVGADLSAIVREAGVTAIKRWSKHGHQEHIQPSDAAITFQDVLSALPSVRPSALREVFIETPQISWQDVGGQDLVRSRLRECVEWPLRHPEAFARLGLQPPRGVLLYGPPGCSKTLCARALASESDANFITIRGPELLNKFVGESERAVREMFRRARAASPCILFFDEIDALAGSRDQESGGRSSHSGVLTSLLNEMDGVESLTAGVTILGATNRPEVIDPALMRPGRLERILYVGPPDRSGRLEILKIATRKMRVCQDPAINFEEIADMTLGCSGAEMAAICREAGFVAMRENFDVPHVEMRHFVQAARNASRQLNTEILAKYKRWRAESGIQEA